MGAVGAQGVLSYVRENPYKTTLQVGNGVGLSPGGAYNQLMSLRLHGHLEREIQVHESGPGGRPSWLWRVAGLPPMHSVRRYANPTKKDRRRQLVELDRSLRKKITHFLSREGGATLAYISERIRFAPRASIEAEVTAMCRDGLLMRGLTVRGVVQYMILVADKKPRFEVDDFTPDTPPSRIVSSAIESRCLLELAWLGNSVSADAQRGE